MISALKKLVGIDPRVGQRVRSVQMNGCMAHIETNERWGTIERIEMKVLAGGGDGLYAYAWVKFDNGSYGYLPASTNYMRPEGDHQRVSD